MSGELVSRKKYTTTKTVVSQQLLHCHSNIMCKVTCLPRKFEALQFKHLCSHEIDSDFQADASAFFSKDRTKKQTMPGAFGAHVSGAARSVFCTVPQTSQIHLRTPACLLSRHKTLRGAMLVGGSVITAEDFSGRSNSIGGAKYIAAFKKNTPN